MVKRFADPPLRARIIKEAEEAMAARFGGPQGVYLPATQRELTAMMKEMNAGGGETIVRILEQGTDPGAILRFGAEEDLVKILQDPVTSMACDCGASTATRVHPRFYGSFPRLLGRYVREKRTLSLEEAVRKMTTQGALAYGFPETGAIRPGYRANLVVFDAHAVEDRATFEDPLQLSLGIRDVFVGGAAAVRDGKLTGVRSGKVVK